VISIILSHLAKCLFFRFHSFALSRLQKGMKAAMALFTMSFSLHIASSKTGLEIDQYGYQSNWFVMGTLGILAVGVSGYKTSTTRKAIIFLWRDIARANQHAGSIAPLMWSVIRCIFYKILKTGFYKRMPLLSSRNSVFINQGYLELTFLN
jgi:hypothetical protein